MATFVTTIKIISVLSVLAAQRALYAHTSFMRHLFAKESKARTGVCKNKIPNIVIGRLKFSRFKYIKRRGVVMSYRELQSSVKNQHRQENNKSNETTHFLCAFV